MPNTISQEIDSIEAITARLEQMIAKKIPPSISILVLKNDSIVYSKAIGYADEPRKIRAKAETVYQWWSITKVFTATAILQLQEMDLLQLDDPVNKYLEDLLWTCRI